MKILFVCVGIGDDAIGAYAFGLERERSVMLGAKVTTGRMLRFYVGYQEQGEEN
jgi:hypothetical protein